MKIIDSLKRKKKQLNKKRNKEKIKQQKLELLDVKIPSAYAESAQMPVDEKKMVFVEVMQPQLSNSLSYMYDYIQSNYDFEIKKYHLIHRSTTQSDYESRCLEAVRDIATAKYVFTSDASNALSAIPLREETKFVQLWHGCGAFKKFGFSTSELLFGANREERTKHPFYKNYSLVTVSSPEVIWAYNEAMGIDENSGIVKATGVSRTDVFFDEARKKAAFKKVEDVVPQTSGKKIILYAPTFRGKVGKAKAPGALDVKAFCEAFGDEYVLLIKNHHFVKYEMEIPEEFKNFAFDVSNKFSIEDLIFTADICISDYSSLVFEYCLFDKPIIFFAYDIDEYYDWRGFYYDYEEFAPGLIAKTNDEMIDYIKNIDTQFDLQKIKDFRQKFMSSCDGHSTERILQITIDNLEQHKKHLK